MRKLTNNIIATPAPAIIPPSLVPWGYLIILPDKNNTTIAPVNSPGNTGEKGDFLLFMVYLFVALAKIRFVV